MITFSSNPQSIPVYKKASRYLERNQSKKPQPPIEYLADYIEDVLLGKIAESTDISAYLSQKKRNTELNKQYSKDKSLSNQPETDNSNNVISEDRHRTPDSQNDYHDVEISEDYEIVGDFFLRLVRYIEENSSHNLVAIWNQLSAAETNNNVEEFSKARSVFVDLSEDYDNLFDLNFEKFLPDNTLPEKVADILEHSVGNFTLVNLIRYITKNGIGEKLGLNTSV